MKSRLLLPAVVLAWPLANCAQDDSGALARAAQNPIASMISVPFQYNHNADFGPREKPQQVLNIQPIYPFDLGPAWNLIARTIEPPVSMPGFTPGQTAKMAWGDIQFSAFFSPRQPTAGGWIRARGRSSSSTRRAMTTSARGRSGWARPR